MLEDLSAAADPSALRPRAHRLPTTVVTHVACALECFEAASAGKSRPQISSSCADLLGMRAPLGRAPRARWSWPSASAFENGESSTADQRFGHRFRFSTGRLPRRKRMGRPAIDNALLVAAPAIRIEALAEFLAQRGPRRGSRAAVRRVKDCMPRLRRSAPARASAESAPRPRTLASASKSRSVRRRRPPVLAHDPVDIVASSPYGRRGGAAISNRRPRRIRVAAPFLAGAALRRARRHRRRRALRVRDATTPRRSS